MEVLPSRDEWRHCCVVERGTNCLVNGAVEVSVCVNSGIVDVGAGSS